MRWRLMYGPAVVSYLYSLRLAGRELQAGIQAIGREAEPWIEDRAIDNRTGRHERFIAGHWVVYRVEEEEGTIRILAVQTI